MILAAIAFALAGRALPLPTVVAADFADLCLTQAAGFPQTNILARSRGWTDQQFENAIELQPQLRNKVLFSASSPQRTLWVGVKLGFVGDSPHTSCSVSVTGSQFAELADALAAKLGRAPNKRDETGRLALWAVPGTKRIVVVGQNLVSKNNSIGVAAIDELKSQGSK